MAPNGAGVLFWANAAKPVGAVGATVDVEGWEGGSLVGVDADKKVDREGTAVEGASGLSGCRIPGYLWPASLIIWYAETTPSLL